MIRSTRSFANDVHRLSARAGRCSSASVVCLALAGSAAAQAPVAKVSTVAPTTKYYTLEATLPVPPRVVMPGQTTVPLALSDGTNELTTQCEIVSRYPSDPHGADVVHLIARVVRPDHVAIGQEMEFDVVRTSQSRGSFQPTPRVTELLSTPGAVRLTSRDLHGNGYSADLLAKVRAHDSTVQVPLNGKLVRQTRSHEVLAPDPGAGTGQQAPYPHMMGAHVFTKVYANGNFVILELVLHNGMVGADPSPLDDAIDDIYFDELNLHIPAGWEARWAFDNPLIGDPVPDGSGVRIPMVEAMRTGQFHNLHQQAQFVRRMVLAPTQDGIARGLQVLRRETVGFCVPGPEPQQASADPADDDWSWWNAATARFQTTNTRLPHLGHMSRTQIANGIVSEFQTFEEQVRTGSDGGYPRFSPVLGWAHPYGVKWGGMTGGDEVEMHPNVALAWCRRPQALRMLDLKSRAYIDRHPIAMFHIDGRSPRLEEHVVAAGTPGAHVPFYFYLQQTGSNDYWGFENVDRRFFEVAYLTARIPYYEKDLKEYLPIDLQHYTRFLNPLLGLVWLTNDSVAKLEIELSMTVHQLSFHQYFNSGHGHVQGTGLLQRIEDVTENPGQGANFGRGVAWGLTSSMAHYATTHDADRERMFPWFRLIAETAREGQSTCTGNPSALPIDKHFKGAYQSRQSFEVGFMLNAAWGMKTTVFDGKAQNVANMMRDYVVDGAYSSVHPPFWHDVANGQYRLIAVRPRHNHLNEFCHNIPQAGYLQNPYFDHTTAMPTWSFAYEVTQDPLFLQRTIDAIGGSGNSLMDLEGWGLTEIDKTAPLIALLQAL